MASVVVEGSPADAGIDPARFDDLVTRACREVDEGLLPSCQLAVARDGAVAATATIGAPPGRRWVIFSATKPIVAAAVWQLLSEGVVDTGVKVAELIEEFGTNGKDVVTLEQVLLHTSGFPHAPMPPRTWNDRAARLERFGNWRLNWEPGTAFEYHATSAHWVLAEVITRVTGRDHRDVVNERVLDPLGLRDLRLGVDAADQGDINDAVGAGEPATEDEMEAATGLRVLVPPEVTTATLLHFNDGDARAAGVPGAGAVSTAADLALFYQALLHNRQGLWEPAMLRDVTSHVRNTFVDPMTGVPANRTLGLVVAGGDGNAYRRHNLGRTVSPAAFGHSGAGGQIAWADPRTGLSFAYLTNGLDANVLREGRRGIALSSRAGALVDPPA